jgi:hypothetical protein
MPSPREIVLIRPTGWRANSLLARTETVLLEGQSTMAAEYADEALISHYSGET